MRPSAELVDELARRVARDVADAIRARDVADAIRAAGPWCPICGSASELGDHDCGPSTSEYRGIRG